MPCLLGNGRVIFSRTEIAALKVQWPASGLETGPFWFHFAPDGDLIDTNVGLVFSGADAALAADAFAYLMEHKWPEWLPPVQTIEAVLP